MRKEWADRGRTGERARNTLPFNNYSGALELEKVFPVWLFFCIEINLCIES